MLFNEPIKIHDIYDFSKLPTSTVQNNYGLNLPLVPIENFATPPVSSKLDMGPGLLTQNRFNGGLSQTQVPFEQISNSTRYLNICESISSKYTLKVKNVQNSSKGQISLLNPSRITTLPIGENSIIRPSRNLAQKNPVSELQEMCMQRCWPVPQYMIVKEEGPPHKKRFRFAVKINYTVYEAQEDKASKKDAKADAAKMALQLLGNMN